MDQARPDESPVRYADFGAVGDGKTDDLQAIADAHAFANEHGRHVRADDNATYYLGGAATTVIIETDTEFGQAKFIIDDTQLRDRRKNVFEVRSKHEPIKPEGDILADGEVVCANGTLFEGFAKIIRG